MGTGARAGASVLIVVTVAVLAVIVVYGVRLWRAERHVDRAERTA
jgi:hypothetical protein